MKTIEVTIEGISPLLMHAFPMVPIEALEKKTKEEQAEVVVYRDPDNKHLYVPGVALQRTLVNGASYSKGKGRATLVKPAAACLMVYPERLDLGVTEYAIDARPVVVPATRGRVVRYRPRLDSWQVTADLEYDENLLKATEVRTIVDNAGLRVGLLDFRPEKKGPFGRFKVIHWQA